MFIGFNIYFQKMNDFLGCVFFKYFNTIICVNYLTFVCPKKINGFALDKWAFLILSEGFLLAITVQIYDMFFILQVFFYFFKNIFLTIPNLCKGGVFADLHGADT
jgi:hypothetical protein